MQGPWGGGGIWQRYRYSWEAEEEGGDMRQGWRHMSDTKNIKIEVFTLKPMGSH